jgi:hypothetical protein
LLKDTISRVSGQTRLRRSAGVLGTKSSFPRSDIRCRAVCFRFILSGYHFYQAVSTLYQSPKSRFRNCHCEGTEAISDFLMRLSRTFQVLAMIE